ncbi:MAG: long-chain fatty acid--CoA ligase, partial [Deltaproteobacteria bacterium]|nr:long-chain fatty acid--CoA ligase [Deltaproteobacteria bacterium]
ITSGGKNVTPSNIENLIKNHPLIEHAMVHGDRRKYLTAIISLDQDNLRAWAEKNGYSALDFEALTRLPEIKEMVQKVIEESNKSLAKFETIKKFIIIPKPFLVDTGELTPTMKVRRSIVEDKYMDMLNALYNE